MRRCPQGMPMAENPENRQYWYALRVTYGREMLVKGYLDGIGVESYIPMHFARRTYGERTRKVWEPLIHNLLFIRTSALRLKEIKASTTLPIRYIMDRETKAPTVIPDNQMRDFMAVVATRNEHVEIVAPQDVDLAGGDAVRVTGGVFAGIRGPLHPAQGAQQGRRGDQGHSHRTDGLRAAEVYRKNKSADPSSHTYAICATLIRKLTPLNFRL